MGRMIEQVLAQRGIECAGVSEDIASFDSNIAAESVCIDFTTPAAIHTNYKVLADKFKATVIGTTGWNDEHSHVIEYRLKLDSNPEFTASVLVCYARAA